MLSFKKVDAGDNLVIYGRLYVHGRKGGVKIGNNCMFANNIVIIDHDHVIGGNGVTGELTARPVIIEDHVWCGANVTITKGVHIGSGAVIGANAVVVNDIEAHAIVAGVPAKRIK